MTQFVRRRCPRVPYREWIRKLLYRVGIVYGSLKIDAPLTILSRHKDLSRSLVGAYTSTFLIRASCRLRSGKGAEKLLAEGFLTGAVAVVSFLLIPRTRIDTCRCEVVLREGDDDADANAHEVGLNWFVSKIRSTSFLSEQNVSSIISSILKVASLSGNGLAKRYLGCNC
jgi:hypothetical protein